MIPTPSVASLGPRCLIGKIYVGDDLTLLQTKYVSCEPHGFRAKEFLIFFSIISLWEKMNPGA